MRRYTDEEKQATVELYFREYLTKQGVVDRLGYPTRQNLERWLSKDVRYGSSFRRGFYPVDLKVRAVEMYLTDRHTGQEVVDHFRLSCYGTLMHGVSVVRRLGYDGLIPRKKNAAMPNPELPEIPDGKRGLPEPPARHLRAISAAAESQPRGGRRRWTPTRR